MKPSARILALIKMTLWIILVISLTACASGPDDEPASISPPEDQENFEYHIPRLLGFIIDPAGEPVAYAEVGGEDIATEDGVTSGDFLEYQGGWIPVTALGYASGYAKPFAEDQVFPFFVTQLTQYQSMVLVEGENPLTLRGFHQDEIYLSAEVSLELFQDPSLVVGLAVIDPYTVSPLLASYPDGEGLRLRSAFALEAFDEDWNPAQLRSGATIPVTLEMPSPLSDQAAFARFDMAAGEWQTMDLGCEKGEGNLYTCQLDILDPLIGIFDQPETFTSGVTHSPREGAVSLSFGYTPKEDFQQALNDLTDWIISQQDNPEPITPADNPTLIKLIDALKKVAMDFAKNNRNEAGKLMLINAAGKAQVNGLYDTGNELLGEAQKISNELGKDALNESDCGEYRRLLKAAGQIQKTGGDLDLAEQLIDKIKGMVGDCDLWFGIIKVDLDVSPVHPTGLSRSGGTPWSWNEFHRVKISTNVQTHEMFVEDWVTLSFPEVTYRKEEPCPKEIKMSGSAGDILITVEGFFDGYNFLVTLVSPQGAGGTINQSWQTEAKQAGECEVVRENNFSFAPFHSVIAHGLYNDAPLVAYADILDTKNTDKTGTGITELRGFANISNLDPEMGVYPAQSGEVMWKLFHVKQELPLKKE